eukprot:11867388-Alexandrium_andersonii.AAC.1
MSCGAGLAARFLSNGSCEIGLRGTGLGSRPLRSRPARNRSCTGATYGTFADAGCVLKARRHSKLLLQA